MEHQGHRQTPSGVYPAHKEQYYQTHKVHGASEKPEKFDHAAFCCEGLIRSEIKLIVDYRYHDIGNQTQCYQDLYEKGLLHHGNHFPELIYDGAAALCLFGPFFP